MSIDIRKIALRETVISELMEDREKISMEEIIKGYNFITINQAEVATIGEDNVWVFTFNEDDTKFAFAGTVLSKVFNAILKECEGDIERFDTVFSENNGLKVKLAHSKTREGRPITTVTVL